MTTERDTAAVFNFGISREEREALDEWGTVRVVPAGQELPFGWRWCDDGEPERPRAA